MGLIKVMIKRKLWRENRGDKSILKNTVQEKKQNSLMIEKDWFVAGDIKLYKMIDDI